MNRREALTSMGAGAVALGAGLAGMTPGIAGASSHEDGDGAFKDGQFVLPPLPYDYDALEPAIDRQTMMLHHDKHHAGYVKGANNALDKLAAIRDGGGDAGLIKHWERELAFNGSGAVMHTIFWRNMTPDSNDMPDDLADLAEQSFGSVDKMKLHFTAASKSVEGSGWGILGYHPLMKKLVVLQAEKHQNLTVQGVAPILVVDVWEHAYYLKYQNNRGAYVDAFMDVVNWKDVAARCKKATQG